MKMKPATELIHAVGRREPRRGAADDADLRDDDVRLRERAGGRARTTKGDRRSTSTRATRTRRCSPVEQKLARARRRRGGAAVLERAGRRRRPRCWRCCRRATRSSAAPRSTAARCTCSPTCFAKFGVTPRFVSLEELARPESIFSERDASWCGSSRRSTRRCAASTSRRSRDACRARGVHLGHRQHVRQPDQPAAARARRRPRDAERDEVPERPQRRDRRRARRAGAR